MTLPAPAPEVPAETTTPDLYAAPPNPSFRNISPNAPPEKSMSCPETGSAAPWEMRVGEARYVRAAMSWCARVRFDQSPQESKVEQDRIYNVAVGGGAAGPLLGSELVQGIPVNVEAIEPVIVRVLAR